MDKTLIPNAQNAELKDTLVKVRPAFDAHLDHAKKIQATSSNALFQAILRSHWKRLKDRVRRS
jgi:hypothetical protein